MLFKNKKLFSIIITSYNNEDKIQRAIDSILNQTVDSKYYEIIVVDDKSTDNTQNLVEQYYSKNIKLTILDQNSGGPSKPRNIGINEATGKYVYFLDADDYLAPDILKRISIDDQLLKSDMIIGRTIRENDNSLTVHARFMSNENRYNYNINEIPYIYNHFGPPSKFIKLDIIKKNNITFPENLHFGEDKLFFTKLSQFINKVSTITDDSSFIDRTTTNQSLTKSIDFYEKRDSDIHIINYLLNQETNDKILKILNRFLEYDLLKSCNSFVFLKSEKTLQLNYFKQIKEIFNHHLIKDKAINNISSEYIDVVKYINNNDFDGFIAFFTWLKKEPKIINKQPHQTLLTDLKNKYSIPFQQTNLLNLVEFKNEITMQLNIYGVEKESILNLSIMSRKNYKEDIIINDFEITDNIMTITIPKDKINAKEAGIYNCIIVYDGFKHLNIKYGYDKKVALKDKNAMFYPTINGNLSIKINK
ncbi:glycosyltransferase family A protein [Mammaliicoccus sp. O-M53]|uniref:glycosyltransferase family 2 protein n=1 Tax=Mammaliicoccus sp. O-M53 TaxID=2898712 RepID=UPI001EFB790D|nr:glycosyltransferase family A protein [Mammaliicoccus sp. O-M53]